MLNAFAKPNTASVNIPSITAIFIISPGFTVPSAVAIEVIPLPIPSSPFPIPSPIDCPILPIISPRKSNTAFPPYFNA